MNKKQSITLQTIFKNPPQSNVKWTAVESLFKYLGAEISQGIGSRTRIVLNGVKAVFHKPHPRKEIDKGALISVRRFLENAGIKK
ncbi:type II toxin-antitoxin system HicA family toxin [Candidatus Babeliales bacterium]|nr:type II toxin-antitoxin system HicA family toxin [Candidatus Babeliales bacterium]